MHCLSRNSPNVVYSHGDACGKGLDASAVHQPRCTTQGALFLFCEASGMASLRSQYSACGDAPPKARNTGRSARHFFLSFGVRASTRYSACGDAPPTATNTGRSARHFFLSFGGTMSSCTLPKFQPKFVENPVNFRPPLSTSRRRCRRPPHELSM